MSKITTVTPNANGWTPALETLIANAVNNDGKVTNSVCAELAKNADFVAAGKKTAAIRGKAISMGIYQKEAASDKPSGSTPTRKIEYVNAVETILSMPKGSLATLEKASKDQLEALSSALVSIADQAK